MKRRGFKIIMTGIIWLISSASLDAKSPTVAYDIDMAKDICGDLPLENIEGIWIYPDDKVTVLILNDNNKVSSALSSYTISVVETTDARLHPGEVIGKLYETAQEGTFEIKLSTEKKNNLLLKPLSVLATLSKEGDSFLIKRQRSPLKGRLNFNFNRLLPGFWKIVSTGITTNSTRIEPPVGMVKVYPSYDGNGSSRRKIRYL